MKSISQILATILISLALVNAAPVAPDNSGFPQPMDPITGTVDSVGSLFTGADPSKDGSAFPNPVGEVVGVLKGSSGAAGTPAARRQIDPAAAGELLTTGESLLRGNAAVYVKRQESASPSLDNFSNVGDSMLSDSTVNSGNLPYGQTEESEVTSPNSDATNYPAYAATTSTVGGSVTQHSSSGETDPVYYSAGEA